jgi:hypothetical protein
MSTTCSTTLIWPSPTTAAKRRIGAAILEATEEELFVSIHTQLPGYILMLLFSAVKVTPRSILHTDLKNPDCSPTSKPMEIKGPELKSGEKISITYSYSVKFIVSNSFSVFFHSC